MKNLAKLILVLTIICVASGSLMAFVYGLTKERIRIAQEEAKNRAIKTVLPECDNNPVENAVTIEVDGQTWTFFVARKGGQFAGAAFLTSSSEGYGGTINVMVGVNVDGKVQAIEILPPVTETPGLGAKITEKKFKDVFAGKNIKETKWAVIKDKGDIDQITAATISSRAVVGAVKTGLDLYTQNMEKIRK